jgi:hypothetical protein
MPPFSELPEIRVKTYAAQNFILSTDVSSFYHSIYTHSIPWALHGKALAKQNRDRNDPTVFGNAIDFFVRQSQDGQTKGLPVGPDTSRIISEIILSAVDEEYQASAGHLVKSGFRYVDDMFYCFDTIEDSELALSLLKRSLKAYELEVNSTKTKTINATDFNEDVWPYLINRIKIESRGEDQRRSLSSFFALAIQVAKEYPHESIGNYAIKLTTNTLVEKRNWELYESFLIRLARESTNSIDTVVKIICTYASIDCKISDNVAKFVNATIVEHARLKHHFEVSWVLWLALSLKITVEPLAVDALSELPNSVCALLAFHLQQENLLSKPLDVTGWLANIDKDTLYKEHWLLVYEAGSRGWLGAAALNAVQTDSFFSAMQTEKVSFYDEKAFNQPLKIPHISRQIALQQLFHKKGLLPGRVFIPKEKGAARKSSTYQSLGSDYGGEEIGMSLSLEPPDDDFDLDS